MCIFPFLTAKLIFEEGKDLSNILSFFSQEAAENYTFVIFLIMMIGFTMFVFFKVPETKGKTIEEIAGKFAPSGDRIEVRILTLLSFDSHCTTVGLKVL